MHGEPLSTPVKYGSARCKVTLRSLGPELQKPLSHGGVVQHAPRPRSEGERNIPVMEPDLNIFSTQVPTYVLHYYHNSTGGRVEVGHALPPNPQ